MTKISSDELTQLYQKIFVGVDYIYGSQRISKRDYVDIYSKVHNFCVRKIESCGYPTNRRQKIYEGMDAFLTHHVGELTKMVGDKIDEDCLKFYVNAWTKYQFSSKIANGVMQYLHRCFRNKGNCGIKQLAASKWKELIIAPLIPQVLRLIEKERRGETTDIALIKTAVNTFVELDAKTGRSGESCERDGISNWCLLMFRRALNDDTAKFYGLESWEFLGRNSVNEYIKKVFVILKEEEKRVQRYLSNVATTSSLIKTCEKTLIEDHCDVLLAEFKNLVEDGQNIKDLRELFQLLVRINGGIEKMSKIVETHINHSGDSDTVKCRKLTANDGEKFVSIFSQEHAKFSKFVSEAFDNNSRMIQVFDQYYYKFVNYNFFTQIPNTTSSKSAKLIVKVCDNLLKKSSKKSHHYNLEDKLDQIAIVIRYIEDKDVFQKLYTTAFAKRLLQNTSVNEDAELSMILKLKDCFGFHFSFKLQTMFKDIEFSRKLNKQFRNQIDPSSKNFELDFSVQVLTSKSWPFQRSISLCLPPELDKFAQNFTSFYNHQRTGRKLIWIHQLANGELTTNCFKNDYTLQVSSFQMAVLLNYNASDNFTVKQLEEKTQLRHEYLTQVLQGLIKAKFLTRDNDEGALNPMSVVRLNLEYKNEKLIINLNVPLKIEIKTEEDTIHRFINAERKVLIQAAITRIMKMRKILQYKQLLDGVFEQLSSKFKPTITDIKKNIDCLIEDEYLERVPDQKDYLKYLA